MKYNVKDDIVIIFPQLQSKIDRSINSTVFFFQSPSPNILYALGNKLIILENYI